MSSRIRLREALSMPWQEGPGEDAVEAQIIDGLQAAYNRKHPERDAWEEGSMEAKTTQPRVKTLRGR